MKSMIPENAVRIPLRPLALGEVTGHQHRLVSDDPSVSVETACELYEIKNGEKVEHALRVTAEGISLLHAEENSLVTADHHSVPVAPGEYRVVIQEEVTDWGRSQVAD